MKKDYIKMFNKFNAEINFSTSQAEDAHDTLAKCASLNPTIERNDEVAKSIKKKKCVVNNLDNLLETNEYFQLEQPTTMRHRLVDITDLQFYRQKMDYFLRKDIYSYSITISPKTSSLISNKTLKQQSVILSQALKYILSSYQINYWLTFEDYADRENLHLHGFITIPRVDDISKLKKELRTYFKMLPLKPRARDAFTKIDSCGYDDDSKKRWSGYCIKQLRYSLEQGWIPLFRLDDSFKISKTKLKPVKSNVITIEELPYQIYSFKVQEELDYFTNSQQYETEEEEEPDDMDENTKREYEEYIRLSNKFNKYSKMT